MRHDAYRRSGRSGSIARVARAPRPPRLAVGFPAHRACKSVMEPIRPHPVLSEHYMTLDARQGYVRELFDNTARHYARINQLFSLGSGGWYRRRALLRGGLRPGMRLLDIAVGT